MGLPKSKKPKSQGSRLSFKKKAAKEKELLSGHKQQMIKRRELAHRVLSSVFLERKTLLESLNEHVHDQNRDWVYEVAQGALRWFGLYSHWMDTFSEKSHVKGWVKRALSLSMYQIFWFDSVSDIQVIDETVEWIKNKKGVKVAGFANRFLRWILNRKSNQLSQAEWLATLPEWILTALKRNYDPSFCVQFAQWAVEKPRFHAVQRPHRSWINPKDFKAVASIEGAFEILNPDPSQCEDIQKANGYVQDLNNQRLIKDVDQFLLQVYGKRDFRILDLCASPGGKSIGLNWRGYSSVTATEKKEPRVERLKENLERYAPQVEVIEWNHRSDQGRFDGVWVDAPCSGVGTLNKLPEIRWIKDADSLDQVQKMQKILIDDAMSLIRPGGVLIYSVCSILHQECFDHLKSWDEQWSYFPSLDLRGEGFLAGVIKR